MKLSKLINIRLGPQSRNAVNDTVRIGCIGLQEVMEVVIPEGLQ